MAIDIPPDKIGAVLRADNRTREEKLRAAVLEAALFGLEMIINPAVPVDTGMLKGSGHVTTEIDGDVEIVFDAPHAGIVEMGARPHWVPLEPLIAWVHRHRGVLGLEPNEEEQVARAIQRKIAAQGVTPRYFVRSNLARLGAALDEIIKRRVG